MLLRFVFRQRLVRSTALLRVAFRQRLVRSRLAAPVVPSAPLADGGVFEFQVGPMVLGGDSPGAGF